MSPWAASLIQVRVPLDMVYVLCTMHVMLSALLGSKEAVSTICQAH